MPSPPPLIFKKFAGINNVLPAQSLEPGELVTGSNIDVGLDQRIRRRAGFTQGSATVHKNLHQADGFLLATRDTAGDLVNATSSAVLLAALGHTRLWYCNLPDGRTIYTNGTAAGVVSATARTAWGVPIPASVGTAANGTGALFAGKYQYSLTYRRTADGLEGAPAYAAPVDLTSGLALSSLPTLAGHSINVYLTSHYGGQAYYAGNTTGATFAFTGANKSLVLPCRTDFLSPPPAGILPALWNGRVLLAVGPVLYASRHGQYELFDLRRDFKQFDSNITLVQPVADGIYLGTGKALAFLAGSTFDTLVYRKVMDGAVVLGSGVAVPGERINTGNGPGSGQAMLCIADRVITAGFGGGQVVRMTQGRYVTPAAEVWATFRTVNDTPQYVASVLS